MVKILSEGKTITESLLDNIMRDIDKILTPLKVKYDTDYDGDSVKIEFDDSEAKITKAIKALEKDKYSVLSREGEYWVRFKTPGTDPKSTKNHKLGHPQGDGGAKYWVYKVDTEMHGNNPNYTDIGKVMFVRKDDNCARYQTVPEDRKTFTQNSAQRKIDRGNSYGDGRFKWFKIKVESVEESFDTHNPNVEYLNSLFDKYVPGSGKADTVLGEVVRAVARIVYRYLNDGDCIGVGYGKETCNPSAAYLADNTNSVISNIITNALWGVSSEDLYEDSLTDLVDEVAEYVREGFDELSSTDNTVDSRDYSVDKKYSKYDYPDEDDSEDDEDEWYGWANDDDSDDEAWDESITIPAKSLRESIELTEHVQELGDVIDGFIGNMEDDDIDFTIALYKKVARILGVRDYNKVVVAVDEDEIDPISNDEISVTREDIKTSKNVIKMTKYICTDDVHPITFIREQCTTGRIYLYFASEEDYDRYCEIVRDAESESDPGQSEYYDDGIDIRTGETWMSSEEE